MLFAETIVPSTLPVILPLIDKDVQSISPLTSPFIISEVQFKESRSPVNSIFTVFDRFSSIK
jgi:hypothetical protein